MKRVLILSALCLLVSQCYSGSVVYDKITGEISNWHTGASVPSFNPDTQDVIRVKDNHIIFSIPKETARVNVLNKTIEIKTQADIQSMYSKKRKAEIKQEAKKLIADYKAEIDYGKEMNMDVSDSTAAISQNLIQLKQEYQSLP